MESKFIPTLQAGNGYTYLKLRGVLDEDNLLTNLLSQIQGRLLLIDMAELDRINSCGVRDWVNWLNQIQAFGIQVILLRCSPAVVSQANMVTNFAADAFIHSFYAPYVHPDTGEEQSVLVFTEDLRQVRPITAPKIFSEDGTELEFDEFPDTYFAFVNDARILNYTVPADIQSVIQYFLPEAASHQPVVQSKSAPKPVQPPMSAGGVPMAGPASMSSLAAIPGPGAGPMSGVFNARQSAGYAAMGPGASNFGTQKAPVSFGNAPGPMPSSSAPGFAPMGGSNGPKPSSPIIRHEQPPIPGSVGYQQIPSSPAVSPVQPPKPAAPAPVSQPPVAPAPVPAPTQAPMNQPQPSESVAPTPSAFAQSLAPGAQTVNKTRSSNAAKQKSIMIACILVALGIIALLLVVYLLKKMLAG